MASSIVEFCEVYFPLCWIKGLRMERWSMKTFIFKPTTLNLSFHCFHSASEPVTFLFFSLFKFIFSHICNLHSWFPSRFTSVHSLITTSFRTCGRSNVSQSQLPCLAALTAVIWLQLADGPVITFTPQRLTRKTSLTHTEEEEDQKTLCLMLHIFNRRFLLPS